MRRLNLAAIACAGGLIVYVIDLIVECNAILRRVEKGRRRECGE